MSLRTYNLSYALGNLHFSEMNLHLLAKKIVLIIGKNGCGKTTLLNILSGLYKPKQGKVFLGTHNIHQKKPKTLARMRSFVQQLDTIRGELTVIDTLDIAKTPLLPYVHQKQWALIAEEIMQQMELTELRNRPIEWLSAGERQRVRLAMGFAQMMASPFSPKFVFLDEPLTFLDAYFYIKFEKALHRLVQQGIGIILVSHDLTFVHRNADAILAMKKTASGVQTTMATTLTETLVEDTFGCKVIITPPPEKFVALRQTS